MKYLIIVCLTLSLCFAEKKKDEHAGKEQAGKEHAGKEHAGKEHAGKEHAGKLKKAEKSTKKFNEKEIKAAIKSHILDKTKKDGGTFKIKDPINGNKELNLKLSLIHPVRFLSDGNYFSCVDLSVAKNKKQLYDLDFWLSPKDGKLVVTKTKIHKHPTKKEGKWIKTARYTFKGDEMVDIN